MKNIKKDDPKRKIEEKFHIIYHQKNLTERKNECKIRAKTPSVNDISGANLIKLCSIKNQIKGYFICENFFNTLNLLTKNHDFYFCFKVKN